MQNRTILPEHGAVIIDEAHELVSPDHHRCHRRADAGR